MKLSSVLVVLSAFSPPTWAQSCNSGDNSQCDFEPFNPVVCGPDKECGYDNFCLASAAGYVIETDCCQAPQPSACIQSFEPQVCGDSSCPYDNLCLADLAGYSADQCSAVPEECPDNDNGQCSGEPANPVKCGPGKQCLYANFCLARAANYDVDTDCCQDSRETVCASDIAPVSCGAPTGKQCPYDNQCLANAAGYNENQCCAAVPEGTICTSEVTPSVECGNIPCVYVSQCEASAAGYSADECCPQTEGVCTADNDPVACGDNRCLYSSQSCASGAGWSEAQCCKQPKEVGTCTTEIDPHVCGNAICRYDNACIAELAGFDPNSCVKVKNPTVGSTNGETSGAVGKKSVMASVSAVIFTFRALF